MKNVENALEDGDGYPISAVNIYDIWLSWRKNLHNFLEKQCGLQEDWVGRIHAIFGVRS